MAVTLSVWLEARSPASGEERPGVCRAEKRSEMISAEEKRVNQRLVGLRGTSDRQSS